MLKKRKHKIKRRNTEPTVNHALVLATGSAGGAEAAGPSSALFGGAMGGEVIPEHPVNLVMATIVMKKTPLLSYIFFVKG